MTHKETNRTEIRFPFERKSAQEALQRIFPNGYGEELLSNKNS